MVLICSISDDKMMGFASVSIFPNKLFGVWYTNMSKIEEQKKGNQIIQSLDSRDMFVILVVCVFFYRLWQWKKKYRGYSIHEIFGRLLRINLWLGNLNYRELE